MIGGNLIELRRLMDSLTGKVHISLRLHHQTLLLPAEADDVVGRLEFHFIKLHVQLLRQQVYRQKAHVVTAMLIFLAGVAQAHDEPVHRPGFFQKSDFSKIIGNSSLFACIIYQR